MWVENLNGLKKPLCQVHDKPILYYPLDSWFIKVTWIRKQTLVNAWKCSISSK